MSMILPKGIVVNSPRAQSSIEELDANPVGEADIARFWKGTAIMLLMGKDCTDFVKSTQRHNGASKIPLPSVLRTCGGASGVAKANN